MTLLSTKQQRHHPFSTVPYRIRGTPTPRGSFRQCDLATRGPLGIELGQRHRPHQSVGGIMAGVRVQSESVSPFSRFCTSFRGYRNVPLPRFVGTSVSCLVSNAWYFCGTISEVVNSCRLRFCLSGPERKEKWAEQSGLRTLFCKRTRCLRCGRDARLAKTTGPGLMRIV